MVSSDSSSRGTRNFPKNLKSLENTGIPCTQSQEPSPIFIDSKVHNVSLTYSRNQKEYGRSFETSPKRREDPNKQEDNANNSKKPANIDAPSQIASPLESEDDHQEMKSSKRNLAFKNLKDLNLDLSHEKEYLIKPDYHSQTSTPVQNGFQINFNHPSVNNEPQSGASYKHHLICSSSVPNNLNTSNKNQQAFSAVPSHLIEKAKVN